MTWWGLFTHHTTRAQLEFTIEAGNRFKARQELWRALARAGALDATTESWSLDGPHEGTP